MLRTATVLALLLLLLPAAAPARAAALGDPAAPLAGLEWIKGDAVTLEALKGKQAAVIEFWATWCPPCRQSIPHLTELQEKFKDRAVIVGVSDEEPGIVKPFVDKLGDGMAYRVASDKEGKVTKAYMEAYGQGGIPTAFIVDKESRVAWIGSPLDSEFEKTIAAVVDGTYDMAAVKAKAAERERLGKLIDEYFQLAQSGADNAKADGIGREIFTLAKDNPRLMSALAFQIAAGPGLAHRNLDFALEVIAFARQATQGKDGDILDSHARVLHALGRLDEALATQKEAVLATYAPQEAPVIHNYFQYADELAAKTAQNP